MDKVAYILIFILSGNIFTATAQSQRKLSGFVRDTLNRGIEKAIVTIETTDSLVGTTLTNEKGYYEFKALKEKRYYITLSHKDFKPLTEGTLLNKDQELYHTLYPITEIELGDVVIAADRSNIIKTNATGTTFHLSKKAKQEKSIFEALYEIPNLKIDPFKREIKTVDDQNVIILINGIQRDTPVETIVPSQIEAIEVINNPSAKYLKDGYFTVINIKLKEKTQAYQLLNLYIAQNPELIFNTTSGGFETGNAKYSFYANGFWLSHHNEKGKEYSSQQSGSILKNYDTNTKLNYRDYDFSLGGDFLLTPKNYLSYSVSASRTKEKMSKKGYGEIGEENHSPTIYDVFNYFDNDPQVYAGKLFYKYMPNKVSTLENTFSYSESNSKNDRINKEAATDYNYENEIRNKVKHQVGRYIIEYQSSIKENSSLIFGSNTSFTTSMINIFSDNNNKFNYQSWNEYLYAGYSKNGKKLSYMISMGADFYFNKVEEIRDKYYRIKISSNINYLIKKNHTLNLYFRSFTSMPNIALLNPHNTSTDSLQIIKGNPKLKPSYIGQIGLKYSFTKNNWYIEPNISYSFYNDIYDRIGSIQDNIYTYTYENKDREQYLSSGINIRYNIKDIGHIGVNGRYQRAFYETKQKGWFTAYLNWRFYYKQLSWTGYINARSYSYQEYSKRKAYTDSSTSFYWSINDNWSIGATLRYFLYACKNEYWINDPAQDYEYYVNREFPKRHNMVSITIQYTWKNKVKKRNPKRLQLEKSSIQLLRE